MSVNDVSLWVCCACESEVATEIGGRPAGWSRNVLELFTEHHGTVNRRDVLCPVCTDHLERMLSDPTGEKVGGGPWWPGLKDEMADV